MRQEFINWLRQTPDKVVTDFDNIRKCPLALFGQSLGYEDATGGVTAFRHGRDYNNRQQVAVLNSNERQILCHADQNHQTYGEVADILEARA